MTVDTRIAKLVADIKKVALEEATKELESKLNRFQEVYDGDLPVRDLAKFLIPKEEELPKKTTTTKKKSTASVIPGTACEAILSSGARSGQECGITAKEEFEGRHYCGRHISKAKGGGKTAKKSTTARKTDSRKAVENAQSVPAGIMDDSDEE